MGALMTGGLVERLQAEIDPLLLERLTVYAARRSRRMFGRAIETPEDYVNQAIMDTMTGARTWREGVTLFSHLCGVVSSLVSKDAQSGGNVRVDQGDASELQETLADSRRDPEATLIARAREEQSEAFVARILAELADEPELQAVVELILTHDTPPPPRALAERIGCPVNIVYQLRRRLQRRLAWLTEPADAV